MSLFVSTITKTVMDLGRIAHNETLKRKHTQLYLKQHGISVATAGKVRRVVSEAIVCEENLREWEVEKEVLSLVPLQLKRDILYESRAPTLVHFPLFRIINQVYE